MYPPHTLPPPRTPPMCLIPSPTTMYPPHVSCCCWGGLAGLGVTVSPSVSEKIVINLISRSTTSSIVQERDLTSLLAMGAEWPGREERDMRDPGLTVDRSGEVTGGNAQAAAAAVAKL
ncbi:hypothetical protein Pmani_016795 [Petrolisthes manimaculis]|uniref:Uncharacterized protein n=1 Tax=Petrolisthes manimaculis TaxID=1843537 RepID=A0AAE1PP08_9EUCA|nr:hypothetical protein Pmani_016795 [Petrolisthes manimaculis]